MYITLSRTLARCWQKLLLLAVDKLPVMVYSGNLYSDFNLRR